jgi:hypothetical protein
MALYYTCRYQHTVQHLQSTVNLQEAAITSENSTIITLSHSAAIDRLGFVLIVQHLHPMLLDSILTSRLQQEAIMSENGPSNERLDRVSLYNTCHLHCTPPAHNALAGGGSYERERLIDLQ